MKTIAAFILLFSTIASAGDMGLFRDGDTTYREFRVYLQNDSQVVIRNGRNVWVYDVPYVVDNKTKSYFSQSIPGQVEILDANNIIWTDSPVESTQTPTTKYLTQANICHK